MSQKIENILNLALEATPEERARSAELDVGYDAGERAWKRRTQIPGCGAGDAHAGGGQCQFRQYVRAL